MQWLAVTLCERLTNATKLDAAITANLTELGCGG